MKLVIKSVMVSVLMIWMSIVHIAQAAPVSPLVVLETNQGNIVLELNPLKAPITTENFIEYVKDGFFDGLIFHRVIDEFMIQGGGFDAKMIKQDTRGPVRHESTNGLVNAEGTVAMARTQFPDSATSQFFINLKDNDFLNGTSEKPGYTVFGRVVTGMGVVEKIAKVRTGRYGPHEDVPVEPVVIKKAILKAVSGNNEKANTDKTVKAPAGADVGSGSENK